MCQQWLLNELAGAILFNQSDKKSDDTAAQATLQLCRHTETTATTISTPSRVKRSGWPPGAKGPGSGRGLFSLEMHALSKLPPPLAATTHPWGNRNTAYKCRALPPCPAKCLLKLNILGIIFVKEESMTSALQLHNMKMCRFPSCTILSQQTIRANSVRHLFEVGDWMRDNHMNANLVPRSVS